MKKLGLAIMCIAALMLTACGGGKSGGSSSSGESSSNASGLKDGQWPAAVYDKYGITELPTKGKIVFTQLTADDQSYQYRVDYNGVTKDELLAWVKSLKDKGFRLHQRDEERLNNKVYEHDIMVYQPGEGKDMRLRISYDFKQPMEFDYWEDEPNPAFTWVTRGEGDDAHNVIEYNVEVSLNRINVKSEWEGAFEALGLKADDFKGVPHVRSAKMSGNATGGSIAFSFVGDHVLTAEDFDKLHDRVADVLEAHAVSFAHAMNGTAYTAEQLKAEKIRSYMVEKDGKKFLMMTNSDSRAGDFGGGLQLRFMLSNR